MEKAIIIGLTICGLLKNSIHMNKTTTCSTILFTVALYLTLILSSPISLAGNESIYYPVDSYPKKLSMGCRNGEALIYDECSTQQYVIDQALDAANNSDKTVLVLYGAEWCIWCHVFDKYINGHSKAFNYRFKYHDGENIKYKLKEKENKNAATEAKLLNWYVAENFVVAHLEYYYSPDGDQVAQSTGLNTEDFNFVPVIYSLDSSGQYAAHMLPTSAIPGMEVRKDSGKEFRGYNRLLLIEELTKLRRVAQSRK